MDTENVLRVARLGVFWGNGEEVRGLSTNRQSQNSHGDVKHSIGNGVAEELACIMHGPEQWCGDCLRVLGVLGGEGTGREKVGQV